jgi:hypothetical protein
VVEVDLPNGHTWRFENGRWCRHTDPVCFPNNTIELFLDPARYRRALAMALPSRILDDIGTAIETLGEAAARHAVRDTQFVQACIDGNWTLAGTLFHSHAAQVGRSGAMQARLPAGYSFRFERTIQHGAGGSRADILIEDVTGALLEFDWKTTGRSALSYGSRREMRRHAAQVQTNIDPAGLTGQQSVSWVDFVRPRLRGRGIVWP